MKRAINRKSIKFDENNRVWHSYHPGENFSHIPGQAAAIRFFDPDSTDDFETIREILRFKDIKERMDFTGTISRSDYKDWAGKWTNESFLFAVHDARKKSKKGFKKVRGFVYIYSERQEKFRVKRLVREGILKNPNSGQQILEVSMALKPLKSGKLSGSGLMSSTLRQSCLQVRSIIQFPRQSDLILFAFIDPDNLPSARAFEAAGFIRKGFMKYDSDSPNMSVVYILSWRKLHKKVKGSLLKLFESNPGESNIKVKLEAQQTDSHCGPAVIQALLKYNNIHVQQDDVCNAVNIKRSISKYGMGPTQIAQAVKNLAPDLRLMFKQNATGKDIETLIKKYNIPVAINWQGLFFSTLKEEKKYASRSDKGHYSIVTDIKPHSDKIIIADPYPLFVNTPRIFSYRWFKSRWWDIGHVPGKNKEAESSFNTKKLLFILAPKELDLPANLHLEPAENLLSLSP